MYPFVKQFISYSGDFNFGMLILDVKGNFYKQVKHYAELFNRIDDLYVIELGGKIKYNPLDKQNLKPSVLANSPICSAIRPVEPQLHVALI